MQQSNGSHRNWKTSTIAMFVAFIMLRIILSGRLPTYLLPEMPHDDGWVFSRATYILNGSWLGPYDQFTLIKGVFSPLFLAFASQSGFTFNGLNTALYCIACVVFAAAVRPIIKSQWLQVLLFVGLLFNPITYALDTGQRVYRNGIGQWQILLIFACLIAVFLRRGENWKTLSKWLITGGLVLGAFLQTREDGTWIYPFVLGSFILQALMFLLNKEGPKKRVLVFLLPMLIAWTMYGVTAAVNYVHYGAPVVNDRGGGNYAKVASLLYAITPNADDEKRYEAEPYRDLYYNIYVSTMEKAFTASPTLNGLSKEIRAAIRQWASWEEIKTGEVSTDHMLFALRDGVRAGGYYKSLPETEAFYGAVYQELQSAFDNGTLTKRGFPISPLIKRLRLKDIGPIIDLMPISIKNIAHFRDVSSKVAPSLGSAVGIKRFNLLAGGDYITGTGTLSGSGWAFSEDDNARVSGGLYDASGSMITILSFGPGDDVFAAFDGKFQNAHRSRFAFNIEGYDLKSGLTIRFYDKAETLLAEVPTDGSAACGGSDGSFKYCIDSMTSETPIFDFFAQFVDRANMMIAVYQKLTPIIAILACLSYLAATALTVVEVRKKQISKTLPAWLIMTGIGATFLIFMLAMCIITATSFNSMTYYLYTGPAYLLLLMFCGVSTLWGIGAIMGLARLR